MNGGTGPWTPGEQGDGATEPQPGSGPGPSWPPPGSGQAGPGAPGPGASPEPEPGYLPPGQPGYGTPAPGQPGYGAQSPGQPGWGTPAPGQPGWGMPPVPGMPYGPPGVRPPDYLAWGVVTAILGLLCCWIGGGAGVAAIVYANQVRAKWAAGDQAGAVNASASARTWAIIAGVIDGIAVLIVLGALVAAVLHGTATTTP